MDVDLTDLIRVSLGCLLLRHPWMEHLLLKTSVFRGRSEFLGLATKLFWLPVFFSTLSFTPPPHKLEGPAGLLSSECPEVIMEGVSSLLSKASPSAHSGFYFLALRTFLL